MMTFEVFIRFVTGEKLHRERALSWFKRYLMEDFIRAYPDAPRPQIDAEEWAQAIIDKQKKELIDGAYADTVRLQFRKFKRENKSRKARESRSARKTHKRKPRLNKKDEPVIREVIRDKDERDINVSDEQAKRRRRPRR